MVKYILPEDLPQRGGLEWVFNYLGRNVPSFTTYLLVFIFLVILGTGYLSQQRKSGQGNFPMWLAISSFITTSSSYLLYVIPTATPIIPLEVIVISTLVSIGSAMLFLIMSLD